MKICWEISNLVAVAENYGGGRGFTWRPKHVLSLPMKINSPQSTFVRHSLLLCCWQCRVSQLCTGKTFLRFHCSSGYANAPNYYVVDCVWNAMAHAQKPDFVFSAKRTSPFKSAGSSVQSTPGSRGVRISGSNAGYTMYRGRVKSTGYPLHSPVSLSLPLPCVTVCHHI